MSLILGILLLSSVSQANVPAPQIISLNDVVQKVSTQNYEVLENAMGVYQAKASIEVSRSNLLPRLNLWRITGVAVDAAMGNYGGAAMGAIEDIAPFLVPANWFRLKESEILYLAQEEGYRALWANEVMTAKALYFDALLDQSVMAHVEQSIKELQDLDVIVSSREALGGLRDGYSREIEMRILSLKEDRRSLEVLVNEETNLLSFMMGFPTESQVTLTPVSMPSFEALVPLNYLDFEFRVVDSSPEVRQYGYFVDAVDYIKKEITYSFLGGSSMSRGVNGGVFDNIPIPDGLGFGTGPSLRIADSQKEILKIEKTAATEMLKRQLKVLVDNYNLDLGNYSDLKKHVDLSNLSLSKLYERLNLGENIEALDLIEASRSHIEAETSYFGVRYRFLVNEDKLKRLIFQGDYNKEPAAIELVKSRNL